MLRELKSTASYGRTMTFFSILTLISATAAAVIGEILIPVAVALLAALFVLEKPSGRILSYIIPICLIVIDFALNGLFSLIGIEITALSIIIAIFYVRKATKAETATYLVFAMSIFILATVYISGAKGAESFSPAAVGEYYRVTVVQLKEYFIDNVLTAEITANNGEVTQLMSAEEAEYYVSSIANALPSLIAVMSFAIAGFALKLFCAIIRKNCKWGLLKTFSHFYASSLIAYAYIAVAIIGALASSEAVFDIAIRNVSSILMFVFAYVGLRYVLALAKLSQRQATMYILIFASLMFMSGIAVQLLSYFGVFINISVNRQLAAGNNSGTTA